MKCLGMSHPEVAARVSRTAITWRSRGAHLHGGLVSGRGGRTKAPVIDTAVSKEFAVDITQPSGKPPAPAPTFEGDVIGRLNEMLRLQRIQMLGSERIIDFAAHDHVVRMHIPFCITDVIQKRILATRNFFEADQLADVRGMIGADSVVVDAGANIGNHTVFFSLICGAKHVHSFEPMRVAFSILSRNIEINGLADRVTGHNFALGADEGWAELVRYVEYNTGGTVLDLQKPGSYPVRTIDALRLEKLDFLKIDVEGGQIEVLSGSRETLARCKPVVWVELRSKRKEIEIGTKFLADLGYKMLRPIAGSENDFLFGPG